MAGHKYEPRSNLPGSSNQLPNNRRPRGYGFAATGGNQAARSSANGIIRTPTLALRRASNIAEARSAETQLKAALMTVAAQQNSVVDCALLGMAAAQAVRFGFSELVVSLCDFASHRLMDCGGREVAELASAAVKLNRIHYPFNHAVAAILSSRPPAFACLRDVSLLAGALFHVSNASVLTCDGGLYSEACVSLAKAALPLLDNRTANARDVAEFLFSMGHGIDLLPLAVHDVQSIQVSFSAAIQDARAKLHQATPQDMAKIASALANVLPVFPELRDSVLRPSMHDLAQAVRFRCRDFNAQDISLTVVALAKADVLPESVASALTEQIDLRTSEFSTKDLGLLLWVVSRPTWPDARSHVKVVAEAERRDLQQFSVQDLVMVAQSFARIGGSAKPALCRVAMEALQRQLVGFCIVDQALLFWSFAKGRVFQEDLVTQIIGNIVTSGLDTCPRYVVSSILWAVAISWQAFANDDGVKRMLVSQVCAAQPWMEAPPFEVANAIWAFSQLPGDLVQGSWSSVLSRLDTIERGDLTTHELCNCIVGMLAYLQSFNQVPTVLSSCAELVLARIQAGNQPSERDYRAVFDALVRVDITSQELMDLGGLDSSDQVFERILQICAGFDDAAASNDPVPCSPSYKCDSPVSLSLTKLAPSTMCRQERGDHNDCDDILESCLPYHKGGQHIQSIEKSFEVPRPSHCSPCAPEPISPKPASPRSSRLRLPKSGFQKRVPPSSAELCTSNWRIERHDDHFDDNYDHSDGHGHSHSHGHGHSDGATGQESSRAEAPYCSGRHGHQHERAPYASAHGSGQSSHVQEHRSSCSESSCCPGLGGEGGSLGVKLNMNSHCDFHGHCVQMKNTFIHVDCTASSEGADGEDCVFCTLSKRRARSWDAGTKAVKELQDPSLGYDADSASNVSANTTSSLRDQDRPRVTLATEAQYQ